MHFANGVTEISILMAVAQEASRGSDTWQLHLQCLLAKAALQLPPHYLTMASTGAQTQSRPVPTHTDFAVIECLADALAPHLPEWEQKLKAADATHAEALSQLLARVQWQLVAVIRSLYCCLAGSSSTNSPTRRDADAKVRSHCTICSGKHM